MTFIISSQSGLAIRPAPALDVARSVGHVVVQELFTLPDVPGGDDPDLIADHEGVTVRRAGVIDEARDVAAHGGVANVEAIELETPDVPLPQVPILALQALLVRDLLTIVGDDPFVLVDWLGGEDAPPLDCGFPPFDHESPIVTNRRRLYQ